MPTQSFVKAKAQGRQFEKQVFKILEESGCYVIDTDKLPYNQKKGCDCYIKLLNPDGSFKRDQRGYVICQPVEIKYDVLSYNTGNVCIDLDSLEKTTAVVWVFGLPENDQIDVYAVMTSDLRLYAQNCPYKSFGGEFRLPIALPPKSVFTSLPIVSKWKSINTKSLEKKAVSSPFKEARLGTV
jgi:hypothetical protein